MTSATVKGMSSPPPRKIHEDAIRARNSNAGRHRAIEGGDCLKMAVRRIVRKRLGLAMRHESEVYEHHSERQI
jgi:hypothetical protein